MLLFLNAVCVYIYTIYSTSWGVSSCAKMRASDPMAGRGPTSLDCLQLLKVPADVSGLGFGSTMFVHFHVYDKVLQYHDNIVSCQYGVKVQDETARVSSRMHGSWLALARWPSKDLQLQFSLILQKQQPQL